MKKFIKNWLDEYASIQWELGIVEGGIDEIMQGDYHVRWLQHTYKDRWFADPFILDANREQIVLLVEEYLYSQKKGRIAKLVVDRNTMQIIQNKTLLEKATHLSFPAILRTNGKMYVYPENSAEGHLEIYEYKEDSLFLKGILCDEPLTDAVVTNCFHDNRIYATKMPDPNGNVIGCYKADGICDKYSLSNTVEFDGNNARMAGDFFEYKGKVYKPSQDCNGRYGKAIKLYETKDGNDYHLHSTLTSIHPKMRVGMHTINSYNGITVIDVMGYNHPFMGKIIKSLVKLKKLLFG